MEHHTTTSRAEAERLLGIAEKLLRNKDLTSCREFAHLAQETEPLLDGSDQILAVAEVLLAAEKKVNNHHDWYSILQIGHRTDDSELIKKQYRRFALLLHPDKNKFAFADSAFRLVADAWNVLSDPIKKSAYDTEFSLFTKVDLVAMRKQTTRKNPGEDDGFHQKLPVRRSPRASNTPNSGNTSNTNNSNAGRGNASGRRNVNLADNYGNNNTSGVRGDRRMNFWTACPYCYNLYEYPRMYLGCCLKCQNCERAFSGIEISSIPPKVPGKEAYYCCWGFFPMGFVAGDPDGEDNVDVGGGFPNWMPPMFPGSGGGVGGEGVAPVGGGGAAAAAAAVGEEGLRNKGSAAAPPVAKVVKPGAKKRGRPRKNPL
ncbi:hypothetical protein M9H77_32202 [Catharanthus roseus]|uniref:Uncharacterized protein n=1 Tax=Catharanthus roseus TaxID=4058 RepID=A0ACC0A274_CATRO|nr:hypothetical protein M9H77_32202 [Catharanthus roseus]